jgi:transposase
MTAWRSNGWKTSASSWNRSTPAETNGCSRSAAYDASGAPAAKQTRWTRSVPARSALTTKRPSTPRAGGERQALQALVAAREGAVNAKRAGLCQLRHLLVTAPEPLRSELRPLTRPRLLQRLAATRPHTRHDPELRGSLQALRSIARRLLQLTAEERELAREIETITRKVAPHLLDQPGVGPHAAAQLVLS